MQLKEFLENFIEHNSVVRLVYKDKSGHRIVHDSWNDVSMEHQILKGKGKDRHYINNKVIGICSILVHGAFPEAINIVIEELETQPMVEEVHDDFFQLQGV